MNEAYSIFRHGTERKGRSVILEREIFNLQNKNPWEGLLETQKKKSSANPQKNNNNKNSIKNREPQNRQNI